MKFCFFGDVFPAMTGKTKGGGELQMFLLAKALAIQGHEVVIVDPYAAEDLTTSDGIKLITVPQWKKGFNGIRFFIYRIPALRRVFAKQDADYYYVRMRSYVHLIPYFVARKNGRKFIQAIASDIDVLSAAKKFKYDYKPNFNIFKLIGESIPNDLAFNFLLRNSDYVVLQHEGQKFNSKSSKRNQVIFPNIIDTTYLPDVANPKNDYYIYVGSLTMLKGADNLLKLINLLDPSIKIMIVGLPKNDQPIKIYEELGKKKNVILKGHRDHKETLELIANAKALINTSYYEGFPNIYLEAWGTGVPVISLNVNPGGIIDKFKLGIYCAGDMTKMMEAIELNQVSNFDRNSLKSYVQEYHAFTTAAERFLNAIAYKDKI